METWISPLETVPELEDGWRRILGGGGEEWDGEVARNEGKDSGFG